MDVKQQIQEAILRDPYIEFLNNRLEELHMSDEAKIYMTKNERGTLICTVELSEKAQKIENHYINEYQNRIELIKSRYNGQ